MDEKRRTRTLSDQGKLKTRNTGNRQSKSARRRQSQSISGKETVDTTEQVLARDTLSLAQARRSQQMVLAFSQAAQSILLAHTMEGVYQAIQEQSSRMGYQATGLELTTDGKLRIAFTGYKPSLVRKAEKLIGVSQSDYRFSPRKGSIYQQVLSQGETIYLQDITQAVAEALPSKMHKLARQITDILGTTPTIISPLSAGDETLGILALTGPDLTEADNPGITAFAAQVAIAMQNAQLCEAAQKDVARCKQAEANLRKSEERYRLISNVALDYVFSTIVEEDGSLKLNWVAGAFKAMTGYSFEDYVAHGGWQAMVHPDDREIDDIDLQKLHKNQKTISELRTLKKDGSIFWVRVYAHPIWDEQAERLTGIYGAVQNINEQKRAEILLRESEERYRSLFERMLDGVYLSTHEGKFVDINPAMVRMFGYSSKEEMLEVDIKKELYFAPEERGSHILDTGQEEMDVYRMRRKDGSEIWVEDHGSYIHDEQGRIIYHEGMLRDITERKHAEEALRESEERFRKIFEEGSIGMVLMNRDLKFFSANPAFCQMLGYTVEEMNRRTFLDVTHPEHRNTDRENVEKMWRGEIPQYRTQKRYIAKNGDIRWGGLSTSLIRGQDGEPLYVLAMVEDITERKQMEEALRQSEENYRELIDGMTETVWVIDFKGNIVDVNKTALDVLGYSKEELLTVGLSGIDASFSKEKIVALARAMPADKIQTFETSHTTKDGHIFPVEVYSSLVTYQGKRAILSIARDITERKRAAETLAQERNLMRSLIDNVPDYIYVKDTQSRFVLVNTALVRLVGASTPDELLGKIDFDLYPQEMAAKFYADEQALFESGQPLLGQEELILDKAGNSRWASTTKVPLRDAQGNIFGLVGMGREITKHKQAEVALRESEQRFRQLFVASPDALMLIDPYDLTVDWPIVDCNEIACQMNGYTREELIGKSIDILNAAESTLQERAAYLERIRGTGVFHLETFHRHRDGHIYPVEISTSIVKLKGRELILGIDRDITERKQAENERIRLLQVLDSSLNEIYMFDLESLRFTYVNHGACKNLGYSMDELRSLTPLDLKPEITEETFRNMIRPLIHREKDVFVFETVHRRKNGTLYPVEVHLQLITTQGSQTFVAIIHDITERKRAEDALATSEAELRALFSSMQDIVLVIDREGVYREIAPTDPGLLYKPAQELLGQNLRDVFPTEQAETFINAIRQTLDTGQTAHIEYELTIGENPIWFSASISPMDADSTLWVARDITEQKQAGTEIRRRAEEFAALYDTSMNLSAEHDLNTLLQTIVENAANMLHAYAGGMYLYNPIREELEVTFTTDPSMPIGTRLHIREGLAGRVAQTHQSMRIEDYSSWEGRSQKYEGTAVRATLEVPMLYKGELIGVLVAYETGASERQFTEADEHLLSLFAFQAAAAIQNARLFEQERTRAHELSTLYDATKTISSDLALESVLETVAEKMAQISHSDGCTLSLLNHEQDAVTTLVDHRSKHPDRAEAKDVIYHLKEYPASRRVLESGQPLTINLQDKEADQSELAHMIKREITTVLMLPLIARNQVIGLVEIYEEEERTYKQEEIQLLQSLAAQAAISIENARLFEDAQRRLRQTMALREIDQAITGSVDFQRVLKVVLKHTISELGVDAAVILLYDPEEQSLHYEIGNGFLAESLQHTHLQLGQGYAGRAALGKQTIYIPNLQVRNTDFLRSPTFHQEGFICYFGVPLIAKGEIKGVLEIFHRTPLNPDIEWLSFMETLAGQVAIAIDNATLYKNLQHSNEELSLAYDATIEGWSRALDLRDRETEGHTLRVTKLTVEMAAEMGLSKEELVHIRRGALLHDIGKMGVPDRILLKPDTLTDEEWKIMQKHPIFAYEMLSPISFLRPALDIPYCHHERWDGTGYPRKLKGDEIPLVARIFAVVDVWDALTSNRPYRPAWTKEQTLEHIQEQSGKHFDPRVIEVFLRLIAKE